MTQGIKISRFNMWRAVVAMIHADGVVTPHELTFIHEYLRDVELSEEQRKIIGRDIHEPQLIHQMFGQILDLQDRKDFFALARALSWCDGDFDEQERSILKHLQASHNMNEYQSLLTGSREMINEVELCEDQWHFKTERSKKLFGFLNREKQAS